MSSPAPPTPIRRRRENPAGEMQCDDALPSPGGVIAPDAAPPTRGRDRPAPGEAQADRGPEREQRRAVRHDAQSAKLLSLSALGPPF
jgi:hypothetical protein